MLKSGGLRIIVNYEYSYRVVEGSFEFPFENMVDYLKVVVKFDFIENINYKETKCLR